MSPQRQRRLTAHSLLRSTGRSQTGLTWLTSTPLWSQTMRQRATPSKKVLPGMTSNLAESLMMIGRLTWKPLQRLKKPGASARACAPLLRQLNRLLGIGCCDQHRGTASGALSGFRAMQGLRQPSFQGTRLVLCTCKCSADRGPRCSICRNKPGASKALKGLLSSAKRLTTRAASSASSVAKDAKEAAVQSKGWQALAGRVRRGGSTGLTTELGSGGAGPVGESSRSRCTPHTAPAPPALYANLAYCYILFGCHLVRPARMPERGC
jgi:hypothetical protein